jgi:hypothetical protein
MNLTRWYQDPRFNEFGIRLFRPTFLTALVLINQWPFQCHPRNSRSSSALKTPNPSALTAATRTSFTIESSCRHPWSQCDKASGAGSPFCTSQVEFFKTSGRLFCITSKTRGARRFSKSFSSRRSMYLPSLVIRPASFPLLVGFNILLKMHLPQEANRVSLRSLDNGSRGLSYNESPPALAHATNRRAIPSAMYSGSSPEMLIRRFSFL